MMRMLTGYLAPSGGEAAIAGHDVRRDRIAASRRLGYLPENGPMYPDMTPIDMLRFFGEARELAPPVLRSRIDAVIDVCALDLVVEKPIGKLSRGVPPARRDGAGAAPRSGGADHGRADRRARSESDSPVSREHPAPRPHEDVADLDPHPARGGSGGRPGAARQQRAPGVRRAGRRSERGRIARGAVLSPHQGRRRGCGIGRPGRRGAQRRPGADVAGDGAGAAGIDDATGAAGAGAAGARAGGGEDGPAGGGAEATSEGTSRS